MTSKNITTVLGPALSDKPFVYGLNNPHPLSQMRTELVWDGKYDEYGRRWEVNIVELAISMQRIETVDEPRSRILLTALDDKINNLRNVCKPEFKQND